jgi:hypothetical protein
MWVGLTACFDLLLLLIISLINGQPEEVQQRVYEVLGFSGFGQTGQPVFLIGLDSCDQRVYLVRVGLDFGFELLLEELFGGAFVCFGVLFPE